MSKSEPELLLILTIFCAYLFTTLQGQQLINFNSNNPSDYRNLFRSSRYPVRTFKDLTKVFLDSNSNPVTHMSTPQALKYYGYPVESHQVVTADGYVLTLHRIPFGVDDRTRTKRIKKPVVFLQHGFFGTSFEWLMNKKDSLLPLQLADAGYDVWFGNARGTTYSMGHVSMSTRDAKYWEYSMNEMGKYDLPAEIDFVLRKTGQPSLYYVGFSMGTTMFFIMMSHHPEYNAKVKLMTALAPVVYMNQTFGLLSFMTILEKIPEFRNLFQAFGNGQIVPPWLTRLINIYIPKLCSNTLIAENLCGNFNFLYAGWDAPQLRINQIPVLFGHVPSPTSIRTTMHFLQFIRTGLFREYDFGGPGNLKHYGKPYPPAYTLKNTTCPVALLYGMGDGVVSPKDVQRAAAELPNVVLNSPINFKYWNHLDYHLGKDANSLVNERVLKLLAKY